jgi:apolipoprotein N-acyltransferase
MAGRLAAAPAECGRQRARPLDRLAALRWRMAAAAASGLLLLLSSAGFDCPYLAWLCLLPVLWALDAPRLIWKESIGLGWLAGLVFHLGASIWIVGLLRDFALLTLPLCFAGYCLYCLLHSSLFGFWAWLVHVAVRRGGMALTLAAPAALVVAEWAYPALVPSYLANSQVELLPFIQSLDLAGPLGLTFVVALASALLYDLGRWLARRRPFPWLAAGFFALLFAGNLLYGYAALRDIEDAVEHADRSLRVGLVQANVGRYEKSELPAESLRRHRAQSLEVIRQGAQMVIWPESAYGYPLRADTMNVATSVLGALNKPLIFGAARLELVRGERRLYNSAFLADAAGAIRGSHDKLQLLPFGEYLPLGEWLPWLYELFPQGSRLRPGTRLEPLALDGVRYGILISFEDTRADLVRSLMDRRAPEVLVNLTDDAWFGSSRQPTIHLALATFRAVEQRRFFVRAANTGVSAVIEPTGRVVARTPAFARANLVAEVTPLDVRTVYARLGDWPAYICVLLFAVWMRRELGRLRPRRRKSDSVSQHG